MVSLTLKVILHVAVNDSKYRDVAPLTDYKKLLDSKRKEFQTEKSLQLDELALNPTKHRFGAV